MDPQKVFNRSYPAQMMALAVFVALHGGHLRCATATAGFYAELMGWKFCGAPAFKSVSNWVERCRLHALNLIKTLSGDYVGILDGSIQIGKEQLLLLLAGLRTLGLPMVSDCSHVMMNLVKRIFKDDTALSKLCAQVGELRQRLLLTEYAFALPATLRDRDRFGRIFTLVPWMDRIDRYAAGGLDAEMYARLCAGRNT